MAKRTKTSKARRKTVRQLNAKVEQLSAALRLCRAMSEELQSVITNQRHEEMCERAGIS